MQNSNSISNQKGAAIILMAFIIGLGAIAYLLHALDPQRLRLEQDKKTMQMLNEAKQALIAWSVSHPNVPGLMPYPDRNSDNPTYYDGLSDCPGGATLPSHLIGRLPWKGGDYADCNILLSGLGKEFKDASNESLWYAVSENLVHIYSPSGDPIINPSIINNPPYGAWLEVYNSNGQLISNRVAAVIIAPGSPLDNQDRTGGAKGATDYLDRFNLIVGGGTKSNRTYAGPNEDFYIGEDSKNVSENDTTFVKPYYFNDKLIYITIDELMAALEKRVAAEVKVAVKNYKLSTGYYPYAAIMGGDKNYSCVNGKLAGALPIAPSHSSSCTYTGISGTSSTSSCSFTEVTSVIFAKTGANFTSNAGACQFIANVCTCNGAGSCTRGAQTFTCNAAGACSANRAGTYQFSEGGFDSVTGKCTTTCGSDITCTGVGGGSFSHSSCADSSFNSVTTNSKLPTWFTSNLWQDYIYYTAQRGASPTISAGGLSGITALTVTTGYPITSAPWAVSKGAGIKQVRLSCDLADYMDTSVNATGNLTNIYESLNKSRVTNYNDQLFIISP